VIAGHQGAALGVVQADVAVRVAGRPDHPEPVLADHDLMVILDLHIRLLHRVAAEVVGRSA
jgi:hypothetical protein